MTDSGFTTMPARVVGIGAVCDLYAWNGNGANHQTFAVSEWVTLDDGQRLRLHEDRGWTSDLRSTGPDDPGPLYARESVESLTETVLNVVLPDEDGPEEHPWDWLADLARERGLDVTADDLRALPYEVTLTEAVHRWLVEGPRGGPGTQA